MLPTPGGVHVPKTRKVKVKAHTRTVAAKPAAPAAPPQSVKENAAAVGRQRTRNAQRAQNIRNTRAQVAAPPSQRPEGAKPRPLSALDVLAKSGAKFKPNDAQITAQRKREIDFHVARLMTTGRRLKDQERTIDNLRRLGVAPGTSEFQKSVDRFNKQRADAARQATKKDHGGIGHDILSVFHKVYGGGDKGKGRGGEAAAIGNRSPFGGQGLYTIPKNVGLVIASDPKKQVPLLAKQGAASVASIPAGITALLVHPEETVKNTAKDYGRRYGALASGDEKAFRKRLQKEGTGPEVFDMASAASAGGATVGRGLQVAARAGRLGEAAERIATVRPALRASGNVVKEQPIHENFIRNAAGAARDSARARVQARRAAHDNAPLEVRQAEAAGEVTHIRPGATKRAQHKMAAEGKGRRLAQMKAEGHREEKAARSNVGSLNKTERRALNYAMKFGIHDADTARQELPGWIERVKAERARHEAETGRKIPPKQDEIPELEYLLQHADEAFTPNVARVAQEEGERAARIGASDPGFDNTVGERRRHIAQAELTGEARPLTKQEAEAAVSGAQKAVKEAEQHLRRAHGEEDVRAAEAALDGARATLKRATAIKNDGGYLVKDHGSVTGAEFDAQHLPGIREAARERGLAEAAYTVSEKRPVGVFSAFGVGGKKAIQASKRYEGSLLRTGRENTNPEAHVLSIQKGIKRKHNWNLVADTFEEHAAPDLRNMTLDELKDELDRRGIDPDSVAFWNPGRYKAERTHFDKATGGGGEADIADPTFESRNVQDALKHSTVDDIDKAPRDFVGTSGWSVIPRAVYDEIHADVKPSGKGARGYEIIKGKISRTMLANPAWLQFQVASNALMTGLAGVGPSDAIKAQRWWKTLSTAERDAIEPYIGVHDWYDDQRKLGAASNGRIVHAYRAFRDTSFYRTAHKGNPLDLLFRADHAQNNFFRRAVLYNRLKRQAYANMGREARKITVAQQRIVDGILGRSPEEAMRALLHDGAEIEKHAKAVNDFLGNWTTYTARERRLFSRSVMFYGFLRFSTKLAFYTMPIEHPLMSSILMQMGHLQYEELEKLFGGDVPFWEIGSFYDHGHKFNLARLNPFFNALQWQGPGSIVSSFGPVVSSVVDQIAGKNVAFDKLFTVNGDTRFVGRAKDLTLADRFNIFASEFEKVSPYARMMERWRLKGRQTSDSWLLHPRGTGSPGLGEKSHKLGDVLKEGLAPLTGENGHPALAAAKAAGGSKVTISPAPSKPAAGELPPLPPLPALPPLPKTITIQVR